jgi:transposase
VEEVGFMSEILDVPVSVHAVGMADIPDPHVAPRAVPRTFPASYKTRILAEFEELPKADRAGFLRREGLYSTLIRKWQKQAEKAGATGLVDSRPGRPPTDPGVKEIARLNAQIVRLQRELADSRRINDVQAKLFVLLGELSKSTDRTDRPSS